MGGAWGSDPWKRYVYRWYTDLGWTEYVSDGARQDVDPPGDRSAPARTPPPATSHAPRATAAAPAAATSTVQPASLRQSPVRPAPARPVPTAPAAVAAVMPRPPVGPPASTSSAAPTTDAAPNIAPNATADASASLALALGSASTQVGTATPATGTPRPVATGSPATGTTTGASTVVPTPTSGSGTGRARTTDTPTSERLRWVWIGAGMVASFTLGALVFGGGDGRDAQAGDTPAAATTVTVPETVSTTVPLTVASTLPPTLPETSPPTTTPEPADPAQVAGNDRRIDDVEWFVLTANFRDQFGFDIPPRDVATTLGTQACDAATASATAVEFDAALRPLIDASGLSFTRATQAMGAFGGVMCVDEFVKFLPPPTGG